MKPWWVEGITSQRQVSAFLESIMGLSKKFQIISNIDKIFFSLCIYSFPCLNTEPKMQLQLLPR